MKTKIYCFNNGGSPGWLHAMALGEDGRIVAEHVCSHEGYMKHDLGVEGSTWKHEYYNQTYGEGNWETVWVETKDLKTHEGFQAAIKLAREKASEIPDDRKAGATLTVVDAEGKESNIEVRP